ncbi:MAG TPA: tRNA (guanosine(37)-N1)-methyltransferase TrmD [Coriobacteriia bacterium]|nr:MAG: tRNA (guanine-N(1)-)-methyltransferase [Actinobacteria bacterium 66_15]HAL29136.1 tRNA (guanosine(37)-N1)-methyltransferase TrmD [Coriobacteriia bacterium]
MRIDIITVLPDMFGPVLQASILGRAISGGAVDVAVHDLREWTADRHRTTDDYPFGGGPGMVMKPEPVHQALDAMVDLDPQPPFVVVMSPQGRPLDQALVRELAAHPRLVIVCGRYEGFDDRILSRADLEISIGDYVLTGGELPALVLVDSVARLQPGVLGCTESAADESFSDGLLEYPQYTRPAEFEGMRVPDVLLSGDHARIAAWRRRESVRRTAERRPDLIARAHLSPEEAEFARSIVEGSETHERD